MRQASYVDESGRHWATLLPEGVPDKDAAKGLPLGPPSLESLGLPKEQEIRLHNELFYRRLLTGQDVKRRRQDVFGAILAALKVDTERVVQLYPKVQSARRLSVSSNGAAQPVKRTRRRRDGKQS